MIYSFGGRNFYSFRDAFEVDFRVKPQASEREIFQTDFAGQKCNTVMAVFGANASGKTHLLQVLGFIQWFVRHSAQLKPDDKILDSMFFRFQKTPDLTTELFVEFGMDGKHYRYELSFQPTHVVSESLLVKKTRFTVIFVRHWNGQGYDLKTQDFGENTTKIPHRKNASFISTALLMENPVARRIDQAFGSCYGNLCLIGRSETHDPDFKTLMETAEFFERNVEYLDWVNKRLKNFDLGLNGITIHKAKALKSDGKEEEKPFPFGLHRHQDMEYRLPLMWESRGTQALFVLLRYILPVLKSGGVAFIDEFELGLHSHMIPCLVDLFYEKKHNPHGAQLIFSCHADYVITQLEKYQIQLVDKDTDCVSTTYRLDEIKGVRNVDNHYAKYHAGAYGGTPDF
ncbi:MAG: ATP-binding protein [Verrucomicrobiae bacterium]|nr:ATP-binding protein [Verrucomicrobiae bacterium]